MNYSILHILKKMQINMNYKDIRAGKGKNIMAYIIRKSYLGVFHLSLQINPIPGS